LNESARSKVVEKLVSVAWL